MDASPCAQQRRVWRCLTDTGLRIAVGVGLLWGFAFAQEMAQPVRIGVLTTGWGPPPQLEGLIGRLIELGYRENQDFVLAVEFTNGDAAALPAAAEAMVAGGVDILVAATPLPADAVRLATSTHPIVFVRVGDPIGQGLVGSYTRPGGNVTGIIDPELSGKRLQLFKALIPSLRRVLFPYNTNNRYQAAEAAQYRRAAERLGIDFVEQPMAGVEEAADIMARLSKDDVDGLLAPRDVDLNIPGLILEAATGRKIPSMFDVSYYTEHGALASYGASNEAVGRAAANKIDKIIRGTDPGEISVETAPALEFVVNLSVASDLGIVIPPEVLYQADRFVR